MLKRLFAVSFFILSSFSVADIHTYGLIADAGITNTATAVIRASMLKSGIKDIVMSGDNIYNIFSSYDLIWDRWKTAGFNFYAVAIGNHNKGYQAEMAYFGMPNEYYAKSDGTVRFLVLNSNNVQTAVEQRKWLEKELQEAKDPFVFLVYHHPTYNVSKWHDWSDRKEFQLEIRPVLKKYHDRISAVLVGHDHVSSLVDVGGVPFVVSGAAHDTETSPHQDYTDDGVHVLTRWMFEGGPFWTKLDVDSSNKSVHLSFVAAKTNEVKCTAKIAPGDWELSHGCNAARTLAVQ